MGLRTQEVRGEEWEAGPPCSPRKGPLRGQPWETFMDDSPRMRAGHSRPQWPRRPRGKC